jgi:hypothetical protein
MPLPNLRWYMNRNRRKRMLFWPNRKCYLDWRGCHRKLSRKIWSNMWIRTDDRGWYLDLIWDALWIGTDSLIMLSLHKLKCYVDWNGCDRKLSRPIWSTMWIRTEDRGWCHDLIWGVMSLEQLRTYAVMNKFEVLSGLEGCGRKISRPIWSTIWNSTDDRGWCLDLIWGALWIGTDMKEWCHDQTWSAKWTGNYVTGSNHDQFEVISGLEQMI